MLSGFVSRVSVQVAQDITGPAASGCYPGQRGRVLLILMGLCLLIAIAGMTLFILTGGPREENTASDPVSTVQPAETDRLPVEAVVPEPMVIDHLPAPAIVPEAEPQPEPVVIANEVPASGEPSLPEPAPAGRPATVAGSVGKTTPGAGKTTAVVTNKTNVVLNNNLAIGAGNTANLGSVNLGSAEHGRVARNSGMSTAGSTVVRLEPPGKGETSGLEDSTVEPGLPIYPWPPKDPSSLVRLDLLYDFSRNGEASLQDVARQLASALRDSGYLEQSFYRAPGGFVMVTRLEGISEDGSPLGEERRYRLPDDRRDFSFAEYISHLFFAPDGYYRFVAFVVTDRPYTTSEESLSESAALGLLRRGAVALPQAFEQIAFSPDHRVDALIYEFRQALQGVETIRPGRLPPRTHLEKSGLTSALGGATR